MDLSWGLTLALLAVIVVGVLALIADRVLGRIWGQQFRAVEAESPAGAPLTAAPGAYLFIGRPAGPRVPLFAGVEYILGRGREANVRLTLEQGLTEADIRTVSRRHAVLRFEEGAWTLRDQASTNGTWVNGRRSGVNRLPVRVHCHGRPGSPIRLGRVPLWFFVYEVG